jgi:hypothetical protein
MVITDTQISFTEHAHAGTHSAEAVRFAHRQLIGLVSSDAVGGFELRFSGMAGEPMVLVAEDGEAGCINAMQRLCKIMVDNNALQLERMVDDDAAPATAAASSALQAEERPGAAFSHFGERQSRGASDAGEREPLAHRTAPHEPAAVSNADIERSAALVDAAFSGSFVDPGDVRIGMLVWLRRLRLLDVASRGLYLALALLETPPWVFRSEHSSAGMERPGFGLPRLPKSISFPAELVLLGAIAGFSLLKMVAVGRFSFCRDYMNVFLLAFVAVCAFCALGDAAIVWGVWARCAPRNNDDASVFSCRAPAWIDYFFSPRSLLRPAVFVLASPRLRRLSTVVARTIPALFEALLLLAGVVLFYAVFGVFLFRDDVFSDVPSEASAYFSDFGQSTLSIFTLLTAANNPDIMMGAYSAWRPWVFFFASFIVCGIFFLANIVLATVVAQFKVAMARSASLFYAARIASLRSAFRLLTGDAMRSVAHSEVYRLLGQLRRLGRIPRLPDYAMGLMVDLIVAAIDKKKTGTVSWEDFSQICTVLQLEFRPTGDHQLWVSDAVSLGPRGVTRKRACCCCSAASDDGQPSGGALGTPLLDPAADVDGRDARDVSAESAPARCLHRAQRILRSGVPSLVRIATHWAFECAVCFAVIADFVCVLFELERPGQPRVAWVVTELLISLAFVIELLFEVVAFGPKRFWRSWRRRYQTLIGLGAPLVEMYLVIPSGFNNLNALRYVLLARVVRVFFFLSDAPRFRGLFRTFRKLLDPLAVLAGVILAVLCTFAALGIFLFGGKLYDGNPSLDGTEFAARGYYALNFNDFASALVSVFQLLVVNNWIVLAQGCAAVTSSWAMGFFIAFYVVVVAVLCNVTIAVFVGVVMFQGAQPSAAPIHTLSVQRGSLTAHAKRLLAAEEVVQADSETYREEGGAGAGEGEPASDAADAAARGGAPVRKRSSTLTGVAIEGMVDAPAAVAGAGTVVEAAAAVAAVVDEDDSICIEVWRRHRSDSLLFEIFS